MARICRYNIERGIGGCSRSVIGLGIMPGPFAFSGASRSRWGPLSELWHSRRIIRYCARETPGLLYTCRFHIRNRRPSQLESPAALAWRLPKAYGIHMGNFCTIVVRFGYIMFSPSVTDKRASL